ncbi:electron transport complex subunit E [Chitinimonas lacunae]|uniref:Ion-translocating oxidoreductase complex subunit E n=1 Tax=Chitinimonas lacunae TaxID=1963018 RepID=A0ABV8MU11_9NEIS
MLERNEAARIVNDGLWRQNAGLVQVLGLCPVLVMSTNIVNAVSLGLATSLVMAVSGAAVAALRRFVPAELRTPIFILIIAALVTVVDLAMNAWLHGLYLVLGLFIPLITTNCIVLARAEAFASRHPPAHAALDGLAMGLGLTGVLGVLGALRELIGQGTLFSGIDLLLGPGFAPLQLAPPAYGFLLALLPPGAFFALGLLIAAKQWYDARPARAPAAQQAVTE